MNAFWNKDKINSIIADLNTNSIALSGSYFFIKIDQADKDPGVQVLADIIDACGGGAAIVYRRDELVVSYENSGSKIHLFMLDHTFDEEKTVKAIVVTSKLFQEKHSKRLAFILAHELGHHELDHCAMVDAPPFGTKGYNDREVEADNFAAAVLGSNEERVETLEYIKDRATEMTERLPKEMAPAVMAMLDARINWE